MPHQSVQLLALLTAHAAAGHLEGKALASALRVLADDIESGRESHIVAFAKPPRELQLSADATPVETLAKTSERVDHASALARIFAHWQAVTGHAKARLTPERARAVRARLKDYSEKDIVTAIDGCAGSEFHAGKYDDLTLICRNGSKLEYFVNMAGEMSEQRPQEKSEDRKKIEELKSKIRQARDEGRTGDYERHNAELRDALRSASD